MKYLTITLSLLLLGACTFENTSQNQKKEEIQVSQPALPTNLSQDVE